MKTRSKYRRLRLCRLQLFGPKLLFKRGKNIREDKKDNHIISHLLCNEILRILFLGFTTTAFPADSKNGKSSMLSE